MDSKDSSAQETLPAEQKPWPSWLKVGAVAAVSALAGGLAAGCFYRKTLRRMRAAESELENSNFRTESALEDDL